MANHGNYVTKHVCRRVKGTQVLLTGVLPTKYTAKVTTDRPETRCDVIPPGLFLGRSTFYNLTSPCG